MKRLEDIHSPMDVPFYFRPYIRYSMNFYEVLMRQFEDRIADRDEQMKDDDADQELLRELRNAAISDVICLAEQKDELYVDDKLCNEAGVSIDYVAYHRDKAKEEQEHKEQAEELYAVCDNDDQRKQVQEHIDKHKRFCEYHQRQERWALKAQIEHVWQLSLGDMT